MLTFQSLPVEHQRLMVRVVTNLGYVEDLIEQRNYGLAADALENVRATLLPIDRGPYVDWPALEEATS